MNADADRADVQKVLAGDTAAFENIVRRWQGPLVNLAYRFCHDRSRAEDMAQEAFLRAYRRARGVAQRRHLFYVAICPLCQPLPLRVPAHSTAFDLA